MIIMVRTLTALMTASVIFQGWNFALNQFDPFHYYSIDVLTPQVKRGGMLLEKLHMERFRICEVRITRIMTHVETGTILLPRTEEPGGGSELGTSTPIVQVQVPADAPLGKVCMIQRSASHCIDGMHVTPWPKACFEVVE